MLVRVGATPLTKTVVVANPSPIYTPVNTEVSTFKNNISSNSFNNSYGYISAQTLQLIDIFVSGCKVDNTWSKITYLCLLCGYNIASALTWLKYQSGNASLVPTGFAEKDYSESTGLKGNTGRYLNSGVSSNTLGSSAGLFFYGRSLPTAGTQRIYMGARSASTSQQFVLGRLNNGSDDSVVYGSLNTVAGRTITSSPGFYYGIRTNATSMRLYRNGVAWGTVNTTAVTPVTNTLPLYVFARNLDGTADLFADVFGGAFGFTNGTLTGSDVSNLYFRIQAFQQALGRET